MVEVEELDVTEVPEATVLNWVTAATSPGAEGSASSKSQSEARPSEATAMPSHQRAHSTRAGHVLVPGRAGQPVAVR